MFNFGQSSTTAGNTFGTTTPSTGSLFGGGDASKAFQPTTSAPAGQDNKQNVFGSPTFGSFMFGAKTTTAATSNLFSPATTSTGSTFGATKPVSFDFGSPPNQTVGSPGFGAPQQQQQAQPLSFGTPAQQTPQQQQQQPAPTFGSPAQTAATTTSMPFSSPSFSFKPANAGTGFSFATPTSGFSAPQLPTTASTSSTPQTTQSPFAVPAQGAPPPSGPGFGQGFGGASSFGGATAAPAGVTAPTLTPAPLQAPNTNSGLSFSTPSAQSSAPQTFSYGQPTLSFGQTQPTTTNQPTALNLATTTSSGFSFTPKATLSFPTSTTQSLGTTQPSLSLGTTQPTLSLGTTQPTLNLGTTQPTLGLGTTSQPSLSLGTTQPTLGLGTAQPSLSLGTTQPTLGLGTSTSSQPAISLGTTTSQPTLSLGTTSSLSTGLSFKPPMSTAISSAASTTAVTGISFGKSTAATTMATLTTATTTTAAPPAAIASLTFAQLQENINKWTQELEEQEKTFLNQATQLNAWDRLVIANGEKIVELNDAVQTVKNEQESLEHEIGFVLAQQKELEELLAPMEKQLLEDPGDRLRDPEREHMYFLAENLERQMRQMSEDLKEVIEHLNETNRSQDSNDPIVQIGRILNAHMSSMQWIDNSIAQISTKLDQLKATHDTLRRDNERSFQKTYN